jgi:hypothetical protein
VEYITGYNTPSIIIKHSKPSQTYSIMIKINRYKRNVITIYSPNGDVLLDDCDEFTLCDIQCQIAENNLMGYSYSFNGESGVIDNKGQLSNWIKGMFDLQNILYFRLFNAGVGRVFEDNERLETYKLKD